LIVPSTIVMPRDGSFALAFLGRATVHDPVFSLALGRNNLARKRIVDLVSCSLASFIIFIVPNKTKTLAVGHVPLGSEISVKIPYELLEKTEAILRQRDPEFELDHHPIEICIGDRPKILYCGHLQMGGYHVSVEHRFLPGLPGTEESVSITLGLVSPNGMRPSPQFPNVVDST
jgi:hypothetical protein